MSTAAEPAVAPASLPPTGAEADELIEACTRASINLLKDNLTPSGILAASRTKAAESRSYTRVFGRDAAI